MRKMRTISIFVFIFAILGSLGIGCAKKRSETLLPSKQPANIVAVQPNPNHLVGPPFVPPPLAVADPITLTKVNGDGLAHLGSQVRLEVMLTDGNGKPLAGGYVSFDAVVPGTFYGLGTCTTDGQGMAWVTAVPLQPGPADVRVFATIPYHQSNDVIFTVTGQ